MTAILLVLLALPIGGPQQNRLRPQQASMLFDEQHLGKDGMDAFLHPESVTFQRVYPVETADEGSFRVGKWTLHPAGPEHDVPSGTPSLLATVLQTPHFESLTMCLLHPDHVLRFKNAASACFCY